MDLAAERGSTVPAGTETALLIRVQLISIDEGDEAERVVIGLGAGRSAGGQLIDQIQVDAKSGLTPGMAETMGAVGLAGHLLVSAVVSGGVHVVSEKLSDTVVADADRAAGGIAKKLAVLFGQQGWKNR